jgi:hypothetical protein
MSRGKDLYWSPSRRSLVGDQKSFPWVSEIFPSCPLTGVRSFIFCTSARQNNHAHFTGKCMLYVYIDKSTIYFSNMENNLAVKRSMECKQNQAFVSVCVFEVFRPVPIFSNVRFSFLTNETAEFLFSAVWDILVFTRGWDKNFTLLFP